MTGETSNAMVRLGGLYAQHGLYPGSEPDCATCDDDGYIDDQNCTDCNPTPEQAWAAHPQLRNDEAADYARALTTDPF
ncbi:MAG TPA: hypothetical protein VI172_08220 [Candidatus Dormibacteraeota bacterium]